MITFALCLLVTVVTVASFSINPSFRKISSLSGNLGLDLDDEDRFAFSISVIGDIDSNGVNDLVVGSPRDDDGGLDRGAIYLLQLTSEGTILGSRKLSHTSGGFENVLEDLDNFGDSVAFLGDLSGDGTFEVAVGTVGDDDGGIDRGAVYILSFASDGAYSPGLTKISSTMGGMSPNLTDGDFFGDSVASIGDLNGDTFTDIVVGAVADDDGGIGTCTLTNPVECDIGAVWILFLNSTGEVLGTQKISAIQGNFMGLITENDNFGRAVSWLGDFNGQGANALVVGADGDDDGQRSAGAIYIIFLMQNGTASGFQKISDTFGVDTAPLNLLEDDEFGSSIGLVGDINGDGISDIVVGGEDNDDGGFERGALWVITLNADATANSVQVYSNTRGNFLAALDDEDNFGFSLAPLGDLNGDGVFDVIVSVPGDDDGGLDRGGAYILFFQVCGDASVSNPEGCDDGNTVAGDGCSVDCQVEEFFECTGAPSICVGLCGDGSLSGGNICDDNNTISGDGCSPECQIESGFGCAGEPSICFRNSNSDLSAGGIIGVVFACVFFIFLCCIAVFFGILYWRRSSKSVTADLQIQISNLREGNVPLVEDVEFGDVIGSGNFGVVYKGSWKGTLVALKTLTTTDDFAGELKILSELRHPHVLNFLGVCIQEKEETTGCFMVTEYMERGDLLSLLRKHPELTNSDLIGFCQKITSGMEYLHSKNIIHRDLAARNILISGDEPNFTVKVSDFGMSRLIEDFYQVKESFHIPLRWTAPEALKTLKFDRTCDVWSFGIVLYEIFSRGSVPYPGMENSTIIERLESGFRLPPPSEMPRLMVKVMTVCWDQNPSARPTFHEINKKLKRSTDLATDHQPEAENESIYHQASEGSGQSFDFNSEDTPVSAFYGIFNTKSLNYSTTASGAEVYSSPLPREEDVNEIATLKKILLEKDEEIRLLRLELSKKN